MNVPLYFCFSYSLAKSIYSMQHYICFRVLFGYTIYFHITHKRHDFLKNIGGGGGEIFILTSCTRLSGTFLILRRIQQDAVIMCIGLHLKYKLFIPGFKETSIFSADFRWKNQISNLMKIRSVWAEFFHADAQMDGRTDRQRCRGTWQS